MRDINLLHPALESLCKKLIEISRQNGIEIIITQTFRTQGEQDALYAQGRTGPGNIVTSLRYPNSLHCWGLAFDFAVMVEGQVNWKRTDLYQKVGELGRSLGLRWGGDFKTFKDMPHLELPGYELSQLKAKYQTPDKFTETFVEEEKIVFKDLVNHWAEKDVRWLAENGIVQATENFRPNDPITRAEAATLVARVIEFIQKAT